MDLFADFAPEPAKPATYPRSPGWKAKPTSKAAAEQIAVIVGTLRDRVLAEIKARPGTADEVAKRLGIDRLAARPRLTELQKLELIVDTGDRRKNDSGKSAIVWRAAS